MHQKAPRGHVHTEPRQRMKRELLGARLLRLSGAKHTDGAMAVRMLAEQGVIPEAPNVEGFLAERVLLSHCSRASGSHPLVVHWTLSLVMMFRLSSV